MAANLDCPAKFTATKNRHRVSTLYAMLDLPARERDLFYSHMGHSKDINETVYQTPAALMEVLKVGKHLTNIDKGKIDNNIYLYVGVFFQSLCTGSVAQNRNVELLT